MIAPRETCFCGWTGYLTERLPEYYGDGEWGLKCPNCGHLDLLRAWPPEARAALIRKAERVHGEGIEVQETVR